MVESKSYFIRESSGLIKQVSLTDAVLLNIGNLSIGEALYTSISPYLEKGGVLWLASIFALIFTIPEIIVYTIMTSKISRTGGDYIWISRNLSGGIGSIMAIMYLIQSASFFAIISFFSGASINSTLTTIGQVDKIPDLLYLANTIFVNPYNAPIINRLIFYGISASFFIIIILLNITKSRWGFSIVTALGIFSLSSLIIAMIAIGLSASDFGTKILPFLQTNNITNVIPKYSFLPPISIAATFSLLPLFALYTYPWINAGAAVSSEFKNNKIAKFNVILAVSITAILVTLGFLEMNLVAGYNLNLLAYPTFTYNFWTVAIAVASNPILQWIIGLGLIAWNFYTLSYGVVVFSRYVFALSFDRVLPEKFSEVNSQGSPIYAHLLDLTITLSLLLIPVFSLSAAASLYGTTILGASYLLTVMIAASIYGFKNKIKILKITGPLAALYLAFLTFDAGTNPIFGFMTPTGINDITATFVIVAFALGITIYLLSRYYNHKKGIDLSITFKEIPPE
ncbi:APC family permease [Acidianus brierleyi]|uniref:Amino acid permease n=1 Tax=Acidianus brierleyi TaxID=41673 RepID=A0A2U9IGF7_9CREN|nr:amino acid permease [Acidianus brierleyi]AWR95142.1 amino acid permease [Acidianus brierleyi]